jgi:threonine/homoserine/homoserine lactone efflux protein
VIEGLITGLTLGIGSGAAPGPLTALTVTTTMRSGFRAGLQIAFAPILSDAIIIALVLTVIAQVPARGIQILGLLGALVVGYFGFEILLSTRKAVPPSMSDDSTKAKFDRFPFLMQGALMNMLNPAPWIFWITAGSTLLIGYWNSSPASAILFLITFYVMLVGMKILIVVGLSATRHRMNTQTYRGILYGSAVLLLIAAGILLYTNLSM